MATSSLSTLPATDTTSSNRLLEDFSRVRGDSEAICRPLVLEDYGIQTMADVSPPKWHLAHTSWFFETFLLKPFQKNYQEFHPRFVHLFNSYYETVGTFHPRPERGLLARPTVEEVYQYRTYINEKMASLLADENHADHTEIVKRTILGLQHEQQHQELLYTDIKHIFAYSPLQPVYRDIDYPAGENDLVTKWLDVPAGIVQTGHAGHGFGYDNEYPRHKTYVNGVRLASRLVSNGEFMAFIEDGGYQQATLWLSDGWKTVQQQDWRAPLYWQQQDNDWWHMTLSGFKPVDAHAPVCHVSLYEADAFARWAGKRLPDEAEWESLAGRYPVAGNLRENDFLQPVPLQGEHYQLFGDVWEWTRSAYAPYPGYRAAPGAIGEYNGKFMSNQFVLRGGSCVTPAGHIRASYRNFFYAADRWQFSGFRLAEDMT